MAGLQVQVRLARMNEGGAQRHRRSRARGIGVGSEPEVNGTRSARESPARGLAVRRRDGPSSRTNPVTAPSHCSDWHTDSARTHSPAPELRLSHSASRETDYYTH
eukprot:3793906-Rhodomonas_salina.2